MNTNSLIKKYNVPGPRYTSYPTVPYWEEDKFELNAWKSSVKKAFQVSNHSEGISLYIHLPFCERLCTYCGCNTRITVNHQVEQPYLTALLKEWDMYLELFGKKPRLRELHLGGGTPTFFQPENLKQLLEGILAKSEICEDAQFSFEAHPHNTTEAHLQTLFDLGFRRLSLGIQDFDPAVQQIINRVQTFEEVSHIAHSARKIGYTSVNFDLIYGLPKQNTATILDTFEKINQLRPDRIAFYSYAHVPWLKPAQKSLELYLPNEQEKRELYELGKALLKATGYQEIGMDHFALPTEALSKAFQNGTLHRNFMGYTTTATRLLVGLGVSSIGDAWTSMAQNLKTVEAYQQAIEEGTFPVLRGHLLAEEDLILRQHILNLMCRFQTSWQATEAQCSTIYEAIEKLTEMEQDGLLEILPYQLKVSTAGRAFVRNICMAFDARMLAKQPQTNIFSQTV